MEMMLFFAQDAAVCADQVCADHFGADYVGDHHPQDGVCLKQLS